MLFTRRTFKGIVLAMLIVAVAEFAAADSWRYEIPREVNGVMLMDDLVARIRLSDDVAKAQYVNRFFNQLLLNQSSGELDDPLTPEQLLIAGAGTYQDIAIGKLYALEAAGIEPHRMSVARASHRELDGTIMVLLVYPNESSEPLVLDVLTRDVRWLADRSDLMIIHLLNTQEIDSLLEGSRRRLSL